MRTVAIICEYNPFHFGHAEQIAHIRAEYSPCTVLCIMSGGFVQRGESAMYGKYERALCAVKMGADLVVELPYPFSASNAESFARAGVEIAMKLGADLLCFGSECGEMKVLSECAERMESEAFRSAMAEAGEGNESFAMRSQRVYESLFGEGFPVRPNDILAVCYLRAMRRLGASDMIAVTHKRTSPYSATASREAIRAGDEEAVRRLIPGQVLDVIGGMKPTAPLLPIGVVQAFFLTLSDPEAALCVCDGMSPGIPTRMRAAALNSTSSEEMVASLTSRRDTAAKIRRSILACMTGTTREMLRAPVYFTQLLAFGEGGRAWLSTHRRTHPDLPILTRPSQGCDLTGEAGAQFAHAMRAEMLYASLRGEKPSDVMRRGPKTV